MASARAPLSGRLARRAAVVFLDRDGTLNEDTGYLSTPASLRLIDGAAEAVRLLNSRGLKTVIITNQSGIGRGYFTRTEAEAVNKALVGMLRAKGAAIEGVYTCPHHPDDGCGCRKPKPGLIHKAALLHGASLERSYMVGDKALDVSLAANAGAKGLLVLTGHGALEATRLKARPAIVARGLIEAAEWIIRDAAARDRAESLNAECAARRLPARAGKPMAKDVIEAIMGGPV